MDDITTRLATTMKTLPTGTSSVVSGKIGSYSDIRSRGVVYEVIGTDQGAIRYFLISANQDCVPGIVHPNIPAASGDTLTACRLMLN